MDDRLRNEQAFHNEQAAQRRLAWQHDSGQLRFASSAYLDHEPWIRPALAHLGNLAGKRVLDFGCGHGMAATCLAQQNAEVVAFDLSAGYVHEAVQRACAHQIYIHGLMADGVRLPFADDSFDAIWGVAILHHLDMQRASLELRRVLKPGGVAVFCEPWAGNPILQWARRKLPYVGKERTADEQPLQHSDLATLQAAFPACTIEYVQLTGMIRRVWKTCPLLPKLDRLDDAILRHWPLVRPWCRYVIIKLHKLRSN